MRTNTHTHRVCTHNGISIKCSLFTGQRPATPDEAEDGFEDPVYDPEVWKAVPEEFQDYTLEKLVHNRIELENFNQFLAEKVRKHCLAWVWSPILNPQLREMMFRIILLFMNSALNKASFVHSKLRKREYVNNIFFTGDTVCLVIY